MLDFGIARVDSLFSASTDALPVESDGIPKSVTPLNPPYSSREIR